jgi:hypothetical protein
MTFSSDVAIVARNDTPGRTTDSQSSESEVFLSSLSQTVGVGKTTLAKLRRHDPISKASRAKRTSTLVATSHAPYRRRTRSPLPPPRTVLEGSFGVGREV